MRNFDGKQDQASAIVPTPTARIPKNYCNRGVGFGERNEVNAYRVISPQLFDSRWWILPDPNLDCEISNPLSSPSTTADSSSSTFSSQTSACPWEHHHSQKIRHQYNDYGLIASLRFRPLRAWWITVIHLSDDNSLYLPAIFNYRDSSSDEIVHTLVVASPSLRLSPAASTLSL